VSSERDSDPQEPLADRRRLLQLILAGSSLSAAALLGAPVAGYLRPLDESEATAVAEFHPDEVGLWEAKLVVVRGRPALVVNTGEGFQAVSAVCSHLGCIVKWRKARRQFFCPCHGGRFDLEGAVLGGPPPRPLARLDVQERPGRVVVGS
jgi:cytochrome b6-f complex iron-sulfur subunit